MTINIKIIPKSNVILIPVASEILADMDENTVKHINCEGKIYNIYDFYVFKKGEIVPSSLLLLAMGVPFDAKLIWKKYTRSDKIFFFVCQPQ
ncbi:MAG: hypothetical protein US15_C0055G0002 [Candidatus Moranbacteria bacterium GW2011_GWF1_36_4]|nr:MAG: hypothetical protein US15_C0055G0002 [Candidatus Moranbacteria bacterium GW2011_GWF1_36_4]